MKQIDILMLEEKDEVEKSGSTPSSNSYALTTDNKKPLTDEC